jgi:hypothetical protein
MSNSDLTWGRSQQGLPENWPVGAGGKPEHPALVTHLSEGSTAEITREHAGGVRHSRPAAIPGGRRLRPGALRQLGPTAWSSTSPPPAWSEAVELLASVPGSVDDEDRGQAVNSS